MKLKKQDHLQFSFCQSFRDIFQAKPVDKLFGLYSQRNNPTLIIKYQKQQLMPYAVRKITKKLQPSKKTMSAQNKFSDTFMKKTSFSLLLQKNKEIIERNSKIKASIEPIQWASSENSARKNYHRLLKKACFNFTKSQSPFKKNSQCQSKISFMQDLNKQNSKKITNKQTLFDSYQLLQKQKEVPKKQMFSKTISFSDHMKKKQILRVKQGHRAYKNCSAHLFRSISQRQIQKFRPNGINNQEQKSLFLRIEKYPMQKKDHSFQQKYADLKKLVQNQRSERQYKLKLREQFNGKSKQMYEPQRHVSDKRKNKQNLRRKIVKIKQKQYWAQQILPWQA